MHPIFTRTPSYYKSFRCALGKCKFHCCRGDWKIYIDKVAFEKLHCLGGDLEPRIKEFIKEKEGASHDGKFGFIDLAAGQACPFLNADNLCMIHLRWGACFQGYVCRNYPRKVRRFEEYTERDLALTCPEAVRLILCETGPIEYVDEMPDELNDETETRNHASTVYPQDLSGLRQQAIQILQEKDSAVERRLLRLGSFIWNAALPNSASDAGETWPEMSETDLEKSDQQNGPACLRQAAETVMFSIKMAKWEEYRPIAAKALSGLGVNSEQSVLRITPENVAAYQKGHRESARILDDAYPYLLENYLVHEVLDGCLLSKDKLWEDYARLVLSFSVLRLMLSGLLVARGGLDAGTVIDLITMMKRNLSAPLDLSLHWMKSGDEMKPRNLAQLLATP